MNDQFQQLYARELRFLRELGGEFAAEFPKVGAGRLLLDRNPTEPCPDPYVERLLEGFAFLAARVQYQLDAEFPVFTQGLLETVYPQYLSPLPAMGVVRFSPDLNDGSLAEGVVIPRATALHGLLSKNGQTVPEFRTAQPVTLYPLELLEAQYYTRELALLQPPAGLKAAAGLRLRLQSTAGVPLNALQVDRLPLFLPGEKAVPSHLFEQLFGHCCGVVVQAAERPVSWQQVLPPGSLHRLGYSDDDALLPPDARTCQGYRLLREYFAFPGRQRFRFVELTGLQAALSRCSGQQVDVVLLFDEADLELEDQVTAQQFELFCTPVINLFPKRADRLHLADNATEGHLVVDRTRPLDYEVYQVHEVLGYGTGNEQVQEFHPFYSAHDLAPGGGGSGAYYSVNRVPRKLSAREQQQGTRSNYTGSEVYLSLVDAQHAPYRAGLRQLGVQVWCTNRDLPIQMPRGETDFSLDLGVPLRAIKFVAGPTQPRPAPAAGEAAWLAISLLSLNHVSLIDNNEREGAAALRALLRLFADSSDRQARREVEGVRSITSQPLMRRMPGPGPVAFVRGLEVSLKLSEPAFEQGGAFMLGAVLEYFIANYVAMNTFTETVVTTVERGEIKRWPARLGTRTLI